MKEELDEILAFVLDEIKTRCKLSDISFNLWFEDFKLISLDDEKATFSTPTNLKKKILNSKYRTHLADIIAEALGFEVEVEVISTAINVEIEEVILTKDKKEETEEDKREAEERKKHINDFLIDKDNSVVSEYTFENFIEGDSNKYARAACYAAASDPKTTYNPLFIYGESGLGKTHLLYAVINHIKKVDPSTVIVYKKCEDFTNELVAAMQNSDTFAFKNKYRNADVLLIDDVQFLARTTQTQEEFFHTFSALYESGKRIILTSDRPPKEIRPLTDRLRTRFEGGLLADVHRPSLELRTAIIRKKASINNVELTNEQIDYMAERLNHDIRQIEGVIKWLKAVVSLTGDVISKSSIDQAIQAIDPGNIPTDVMTEKIISATSKYFGVSVENMKSPKRDEEIVYARQIAIYIIKQMTDVSYKSIGLIFGLTHSTVMHAYNKIKSNIHTKINTSSDINKIIKEVKG